MNKHLARMTKVLAGLVASVGLAGCIGGAVDGDMAGGDTRAKTLGIVCSADLSIRGTLVDGAAKPADVDGCWPDGTWKFSATVVRNGCSEALNLHPEFSFKVHRDALTGDESYDLLSNAADPYARVKVTSGGSGLCEGGLTLMSPDGKIVLNMKPNLNADGTLTGQGEYEVYQNDQR